MRPRFSPLALAFSLAFVSLTPSAASSQATPSQAPSAAAISPDAHLLAWASGPRGTSSISIADVGDPAHARVVSPSGACSSKSPIWSPDGSQLAYLSSCGTSGQEQIALYTLASKQSRTLTHLTGDLQELAWSPDGKQIGFLFVENATRSAGALDAMKPWSGVIGEDGIEVQRFATVDVSSGKSQIVSPATLHVFEFGWAPDSRSVAYIAAPPPGENNWWVAQLFLQPEVPSAAPRSILDPAKIPGSLHGLQIAVPRISPDGKQIAFIGGLMSDQGSTGGDLYLLPINGGEPKDITPGRPASPTWFQWTGDHTLAVSEDARGYTHLFQYDTKTESELPEHQLRYMGSVYSGGIKSALSIAHNGEVAVIRSSFEAPPEIWAGPVSALKQITHNNDGAHASSKSESIEWTDEGFHVQGWLTYPVSFDPKQTYPLIVSVHGGPSASIGDRWGSESALAAAGYFVFQPNPRGSFGQGEKFTQANIKDFGYGDLRDILAGMDAVEKKVPVDHNREGLTGWSYGGFMTMFAVTQTHRFRAAVAGAGISDWKSYYGENSIDQWMLPFFGASVYDDPAIYAKSSAIDFIKNVTTPTLVIVGDRDGECPAPQSFEFWHALREEGVKTQLVIYPNEGHGFRDPAHIADRSRRTIAWFNTNMPAGKQTADLR